MIYENNYSIIIIVYTESNSPNGAQVEGELMDHE